MADPAPPLRVMIVDDHELVRDGIKALVQDAEGMSVAGEAGSVREAIERAEWSRPDVVVMDIRLPDGSGIEATREIRARLPKTQVLMLTTFGDDEALFASIMAGAAGYVLKQVTGGDLVRAIRAVGAGQNLLDPAVTKGVLDVLRLLASGRSTSEIAKVLSISRYTARNHINRIEEKLGPRDRLEAVVFGAHHGLI